MVRAVLLTHGLNDPRRIALQQNADFRHMIMNLPSVTAGRFEVRILFCQDGTPVHWREAPADRVRKPGANHETYWRRALQHLDKRFYVNFLDFSFNAEFQPNEDKRVQQLMWADIFYCRGTGGQYEGLSGDMRAELCRISNSPQYARQIFALQYEILQNRRLSVGICGASKWAGYNVSLPGGEVKRGLALFGLGISVCYDKWEDRTRSDDSKIEINEMNYCIVDTTLNMPNRPPGLIGSYVMTKQKRSLEELIDYAKKAGRINVNLREVLAHIMRKVDLYQCPHTHAFYFLSAGDGSARWQPYPY